MAGSGRMRPVTSTALASSTSQPSQPEAVRHVQDERSGPCRRSLRKDGADLHHIWAGLRRHLERGQAGVAGLRFLEATTYLRSSARGVRGDSPRVLRSRSVETAPNRWARSRRRRNHGRIISIASPTVGHEGSKIAAGRRPGVARVRRVQPRGPCATGETVHPRAGPLWR